MRYTIAMCNFNMRDTIEQSVRSIVNQLDQNFELLIVDGGSNDGSVDILRNLEREYPNIRIISLPENEDRHLGADRQISIEAAAGDYVLFDLDCDDRYNEGIVDFVEVYHQIEEQRNSDFLLKGEAINMAPRSLMLDIPFHNVGMAEDKDLYRRMMAEDSILFVKHYPFWENIGYDTAATKKSLLRRFYRVQKTCFRSGISYQSYLRWLLIKNWTHTKYNWKRVGAELLMSPVAWEMSEQDFDLPEEFREMGKQYEVRSRIRATLPELEECEGFDIDKSQLSERGREIFYGDGVEDLCPEIPEVRGVHI